MYIINLDSVDAQTPGVGMKAASLGELAKNGFLVPRGFVVTTEAFGKFLADTGMSLLLPNILGGVNPEEPKSAVSASVQIRELFAKFSGTDFLIKELKEAYNELSFGKDVSSAGGMALDLIRAGRGDSFVSVRPSIACSQEKLCSFAGHGKAVLNMIGYRQLLASIKDCWLSFFSPEAILYRKLHGIEEASLAVLVQKMADSELSGILFTQEPVSGDGGKILVEGWWGLGETLCCGCVSPDQYVIGKDGTQISRRIGKKMWLRRRGPLSGMTIQEKVPASRVLMDTLAERDFPKFAAIAGKVQEILKGPQHVEWAVERGRIVILQSSPVVFSKGQSAAAEGEKMMAGIGVSAGTGKGKVSILSGFSMEGGKATFFPELRKPAEPSILVTKTLGIGLLPYMRWFSGIVAEQGGAGSCLASVGREMGIPIVTGIENAALILQNGQEIVVDGLRGDVYALPPVQNPGQ
jgi:pyruvate,water dikinase